MSEPIEGRVVAVNDRGIKLEGRDDWLNFSKPEYRDQPWQTPAVGDNVRLTLSGKFVKTCEVLGGPAAASPAAGSSRERSIERQVALKAAVELVSPFVLLAAERLRAEESPNLSDACVWAAEVVLEAAGRFASFLEG